MLKNNQSKEQMKIPKALYGHGQRSLSPTQLSTWTWRQCLNYGESA